MTTLFEMLLALVGPWLALVGPWLVICLPLCIYAAIEKAVERRAK